MQCARCFLVLGSLRQAATTGRVPECAVLVPTLHGHDVIQQDNFSSHWCNWESCIERTDWEDDQECVPSFHWLSQPFQSRSGQCLQMCGRPR